MEVGEPLTDFEGVLTGVPTYRGKVPMLGTEELTLAVMDERVLDTGATGPRRA